MHKFIQEILAFIGQTPIRDESLIRFTFKLEKVEIERFFELLSNEETLFFFSKPSGNRANLGVGKIESPSAGKLIETISKENPESNELIISANYDSNLISEIPLVFGGEKFLPDKKENLWSDFPNRSWFIPQVLISSCAENPLIIFQFFGNNPDLKIFEKILDFLPLDTLVKTEPAADYEIISATEIEEWSRIINAGLNEITKHNIEKIVLARRMQLVLKSNFSFSSFLSKLQTKYPECNTFAYKEKDSIFFGSTPEKLFTLDGNKIETEALAGSIARGANLNEDLVLESNLLNNQKDINEHNNVLSFLLSNLEDFSEEISYNPKPQIKKLQNIQHLQTPIKAMLKEGVDILELLRKLHPTPAVCGLPQKKAWELIEDLEYFDRGLYAGVVGWFNEKRKCEFSVGIRSAILKNNMLTAYAGCGIVEGSDPISEYHETELKFKPILSLLENEIINQP
ncbi:MAG: menaquinone-specific isochorismate [Ignavibacteria bacterium]|nr:MAG: menaquinone-specific isochorismate [Ignavibacteria bacterium]